MSVAPSIDHWAAGTITALERQRNGQVITVQQLMADLRVETQRLRDQLADARAQIAALEQKLAVYEATAGRDELLTQTEAARRLAVHPSTISRWVAAGHFQTYAGAGKKPLIYASSLHRPARKKRGRRG